MLEYSLPVIMGTTFSFLFLFLYLSLFRHLKVGLQDWGGISHEEWVTSHPGQVVLTVVSEHLQLFATLV